MYNDEDTVVNDEDTVDDDDDTVDDNEDTVVIDRLQAKQGAADSADPQLGQRGQGNEADHSGTVVWEYCRVL